MSNNHSRPKPFLKWAGGKRWLVNQYSSVFPELFEVYREPFLGGGSVFFHVGAKNAVLGDANKDLIACYAAMRDDWEAVWKHLQRFHRQHSDGFYYRVRS